MSVLSYTTRYQKVWKTIIKRVVELVATVQEQIAYCSTMLKMFSVLAEWLQHQQKLL